RQCEGRAQTTTAYRQWIELRLRRSRRVAPGSRHAAHSGRALPSADPRQDRALAPDAQEPHSARELLPAWRSRSSDRALRRALQLQALPRKLTEPHPGRRLLRQRPDHPSGTRKDQTRHHQTATIETPLESRLNSNPNEPEPPFQYSSDCPKAFEDGHTAKAKIFRVTEFLNCRIVHSLRPNGEGRIAIVTIRGPDGGGRGQHWREGGRRAGDRERLPRAKRPVQLAYGKIAWSWRPQLASSLAVMRR